MCALSMVLPKLLSWILRLVSFLPSLRFPLLDLLNRSQRVKALYAMFQSPKFQIPNSNVEMSNVDDNSVVDNLEVVDNNEVILVDSGDLVGSKTPVTYDSGDKSKDNCNDDSSKSVDNVNESVEASAPGESMKLEASGPSKPRARPREDSDSGGICSKIPRFGTRKLTSKNPKPKVKSGQGKHPQLPPVVSARPGKK